MSLNLLNGLKIDGLFSQTFLEFYMLYMRAFYTNW